ncbi:GNAT family N-acetyltransferase [Vibrio astriarenae]|uniref:GNAT family N-acetyltransferase n=1 Tax=Vibrio astriarenae TaxID=1481923 RepID=A0A7Z2YG63_9VIBR|nr:GNAT family N-acetyltransferase [Vibrio astriarenae]
MGKQLIQSAISWLSDHNCNQVNISVAVGNEEVIPFYEKLGFRKRSYMLQIRTL